MAIPLDGLTITGLAPSVAIGANVDVPAATLDLADFAPSLGPGVDIAVPLAALTMSDRIPALSTGGPADVYHWMIWARRRGQR